MDAVDLTPDFVFFDEKGPNTRVFKPAIEEREIQAKALRFAHAILTFSRTHKAAQLRLLAARLSSADFRSAKPIMRRMNVSRLGHRAHRDLNDA